MIRKILHTSDWHIGRKLKEHERTEEFRKFFDELLRIIHDENIEALLVSGDIFDNTTPTLQAQEMYYSLLCKLVQSSCRHIVIISGNHDSPAFLDAPADLLKHCRIHVIGQARTNPAEEVLTLCDTEGNTELIVCAVPYLRDRDVRTLAPSDNPSESEAALIDGIKNHYARVFERARELQGDSDIPVIAMGHLFMQGGKTTLDDGTRELYIGTAIRVGSDIFPEWLTYTALGHLHSPQKAGGRGDIRYSGSPIAMGFGEAGQKKAVYVLELDGKNVTALREIDIPEYQRLERVSGDITEIFSQLQALADLKISVWAEVTYKGEETIPDLQEKLQAFSKTFPMVEIISIHDESRKTQLPETKIPDGLDNVKPITMLELCFDANNTPEEQREILIPMYREILRGLGEDY